MSRLARPAIAAGLVLGMSLLLVPLATRVWTAELVPAANRLHYGDALTPALALAGLALYLLTSVLLVPRPTTAAAVSSNAAADGTDIASQRAGRRPLPAAGRHVTPGGAA